MEGSISFFFRKKKCLVVTSVVVFLKYIFKTSFGVEENEYLFKKNDNNKKILFGVNIVLKEIIKVHRFSPDCWAS